MARETAVSTEPKQQGSPAPDPRPARRAWWHGAAGVAAVVVLLLTAGMCALPSAGLPAGDFVRAGDEATGVASARYGAGPLRRWLLGEGYRRAWSARIRVPVLDIDTFAGGLTPLRRGGGNQTRSLHLLGANGQAYVFRSVDKDQGGRLGAVSRATIGRVRQDQVGALHPAAAVVSAGLLDAVGVPHPDPRLVVMPDDPRLGVHRAEFARRLGIIEQNPPAAFRAAERVVDTKALWDAFRSRPAESVDGRAFLRARLMDVYLGDWDRHEDQWRWARMEGSGDARWVPNPRDRDYAMVDYGGLFPTLARGVDPKIVRFDSVISGLEGLMLEARLMDARFLCPIPAAAWDSTATALRIALTDSVIGAALGRMPEPYVRLDGAELAAKLRARRDWLPDVARDYRRRLHAGGGCASGGRGD